jgi:hypothetical protein
MVHIKNIKNESAHVTGRENKKAKDKKEQSVFTM